MATCTQIAVIGDTGAGKSSILEAMTYALYGHTSLGGGSKQELMNDTSDEMRVVLRFRVSDEEWEVARVDRRAGTGGLRPARAQLVRYGPGGETLDKVEGVRSVNARAQELIGLDSDAFLRTVILPQGRFARLLVEDAPSARTDILRQVWRTHDLETAGQVAGRRLAEAATLAARLRDEVARHPEDPRAHLADLASRADAADRHALALGDLRDRSKRAADTLHRSEAAIAVAQETDERVTPTAMDELADRLAPVAALQRRVQADVNEAEERKAKLERELSDLPVDDGPDEGEIARALATLEALPEQVSEVVAAAEALRRATAGEAEAANASPRRGTPPRRQRIGWPSIRRWRRRWPRPWSPPGICCDRPSAAMTSAATCVSACDRRRRRWPGGAREVAAATEERAAAQQVLREAGEDLARAEATLREARRTDAAADAAHGLSAGDECPVCLSDLPEDWVPPSDAGLDAAREARGRSEGARREGGRGRGGSRGAGAFRAPARGGGRARRGRPSRRSCRGSRPASRRRRVGRRVPVCGG